MEDRVIEQMPICCLCDRDGAIYTYYPKDWKKEGISYNVPLCRFHYASYIRHRYLKRLEALKDDDSIEKKDDF